MTLAYRLDSLTGEQVSAECPFPSGVRLDFVTPRSPEAVVLVVAEQLKLPVVAYATHVWADLTGTKKTAATVRRQWAKLAERLESEDEFAPAAAADLRAAGDPSDPDASPGSGS